MNDVIVVVPPRLRAGRQIWLGRRRPACRSRRQTLCRGSRPPPSSRAQRGGADSRAQEPPNGRRAPTSARREAVWPCPAGRSPLFHSAMSSSFEKALPRFVFSPNGRRTMSLTHSDGSRSSCGIYDMCFLNSSADEGVSSSPSTLMQPTSSGWKPSRARSSVVLPLPEGPTRQTISPSATVNDSPSKSVRPPRLIDAFFTSSIMSVCLCLAKLRKINQKEQQNMSF